MVDQLVPLDTNRIKKIGDKYYDFGCPNQSFLQTAMELKALGVKNYYFMLEVKHPFSGVYKIDPFKKDITQQEIQILMRELHDNMWFYARTVARVRTSGGIAQFCLHRGLAAAMWCFERHYDACLCEPRQTYKTTGILAGPIAWAFQIACQNGRIKFFGKASDNTKKNLSDLRDDIELLPEWLQFKRYNDAEGKVKKSKQITEILENGVFHNRVTITAKPSSESQAMGIARGDSAEIMYFDEIEHMLYFPIVLANSAPAFKTTSENAIRAGKPAGRIFTTTPGNLDTKEGRESMPIIKSMIPWTERIYDMTEQQLQDYISTFREQYHSDDANKSSGREVVNIFYIEYQYYQLRRSHKWVEEQYALTGDRMAVRREILMQRLRGSSNNPLEPEDIEYLLQHMQKSTQDILLNGKWRMLLYPHGLKNPPKLVAPGVYNPFDENIPYLVGIDPSGGGGGDNTAITVINPENLQIAAEFKSPYISQTELLRSLIDLIQNYIPKAVLIPERNSMGIYLIHLLCESSIRDNLYWSRSDRELEEMTVEGPDAELRKMSQQYRKYGVYTSPKKRSAMFEILFKHVHECKQILNTENLVDDICKLVKTASGRIEAARGEHDDSLMSYLLAMYIYYTGDNLGYFGIYPTEHPIIGAVEENRDNGPDSNGFFSTERVSFETILKDSIIETEQTIKYLVRNPLYTSDLYSRGNDFFDNEVSLTPMFFDQINI